MSNDYFAKPGTSFHQMKDFATVSPRYYYRRHIEGTLPGIDKASLRTGRLIHLAVLEPDKFRALPLCPAEHLTDSGNLSTKKATKDWIASLGGQDFVTANEAQQFTAIAMAVVGNPDAQRILCHPQVACEVERFGERDGVQIKGKADIIIPGQVWDLKTTDSLDSIIRQCRDFCYPEQVAWYQDLFGVTGGGLIVVEKEEPHRVAVLAFEPAVMAAARKRVGAWWSHFLACRSSGEWPNDPPGITTITAAQLAAA
jgi:hypothetical protein